MTQQKSNVCAYCGKEFIDLWGKRCAKYCVECRFTVPQKREGLRRKIKLLERKNKLTVKQQIRLEETKQELQELLTKIK